MYPKNFAYLKEAVDEHNPLVLLAKEDITILKFPLRGEEKEDKFFRFLLTSQIKICLREELICHHKPFLGEIVLHL
jgi:hypothetical protein